MTRPVLILEERENRWKKIREAMKKRGLDCLIVWGSTGSFGGYAADLRYLANVLEQGYVVFPGENDPTIFTFEKGPQPWMQDARTGHPAYAEAISERLRELHFESANIGIVGLSGYFGQMGFPYTTYKLLMDNFPRAKFGDATELLERARLIKSAAEISCLEYACEVGSKVMQAVVETAKPGVKDYEVRAKIMDTLFVNDCDPFSMLLYSSGREGAHAAHGGRDQAAVQRVIERGDVILIEFDARYSGYTAQFNQPFSVGEPDKEWRDIFNVAEESFHNGFKVLKPGITAGELDEAFLSTIKQSGYEPLNPAFHGLGLFLEMPMGFFKGQPAYKPDTSFIMEAGMVLELEPHVVSRDGKKGIHIGSPVLVTETGCRLLTKDWKPEFKII